MIRIAGEPSDRRLEQIEQDATGQAIVRQVEAIAGHELTDWQRRWVEIVYAPGVPAELNVLNAPRRYGRRTL